MIKLIVGVVLYLLVVFCIIRVFGYGIKDY